MSLVLFQLVSNVPVHDTGWCMIQVIRTTHTHKEQRRQCGGYEHMTKSHGWKTESSFNTRVQLQVLSRVPPEVQSDPFNILITNVENHCCRPFCLRETARDGPTSHGEALKTHDGNDANNDVKSSCFDPKCTSSWSIKVEKSSYRNRPAFNPAARGHMVQGGLNTAAATPQRWAQKKSREGLGDSERVGSSFTSATAKLVRQPLNGTFKQRGLEFASNMSAYLAATDKLLHVNLYRRATLTTYVHV